MAAERLSSSEFFSRAKSGELKIESHRQMLYLANLYSRHDGESFGPVEQLHKNGWTLGKGDLRFNRYGLHLFSPIYICC